MPTEGPDAACRGRRGALMFSFPIPSVLLIGIIASLIGLVFVGLEYREFWLALDSEDWPVVEGTIEEVGVTSSVMSSGTGSNVVYAPLVRYHYRVGDRQYVSDRIAFGGTISTSFRGWASGVARRFDQKTVKVSVSPKDPMTAVLEPGVHWSVWMGLGLGIAVLGYGLTGLLSYFGVITTSLFQ